MLAVYDGGDKLARRVGVGHALTGYDVASFVGEVVFYLWQQGFESGHFVEGDGGSCIAFHATGAVASCEVAGEGFRQDIEGDQDIADLYHGEGEYAYCHRKEKNAYSHICHTVTECHTGVKRRCWRRWRCAR